VETKYRPGDQGIVSERIISMTWITLMQRVTRFSSVALKVLVVVSVWFRFKSSSFATATL
jgi:hypothetical protein